MKRYSKVLITLMCVFFSAIVILLCLFYRLEHPFWSQPAKVQHWLLKLTPLGSSLQQVKSVINANKWEIVGEFDEKPRKWSDNPEIDYPRVNGVHVIQMSFGDHFSIPFGYSIEAWWGFDSKGKLIDLRVWRINDGF